MEKIVIYNVKHVKDIIKCAANMRIKSIVLSDDMLSDTLGDILVSVSDYKAGDELPEKSEAKPGIVIFCDVTDKHIDKLLFEMRTGNSEVDYKAVKTKTNSQWTITRILEEVAAEQDAVKICKIDVDKQMSLALKYNVASIPTMLLFKNGQVSATNIGYIDKKQIMEFIAQ